MLSHKEASIHGRPSVFTACQTTLAFRILLGNLSSLGFVAVQSIIFIIIIATWLQWLYCTVVVSFLGARLGLWERGWASGSKAGPLGARLGLWEQGSWHVFSNQRLIFHRPSVYQWLGPYSCQLALVHSLDMMHLAELYSSAGHVITDLSFCILIMYMKCCGM